MGYKDEFHKLIEMQQYEDARVLLEAHKTFAYDDSFYYANMGWVLNHIGRYQEAIPYLQKGIQTFPEDAWIYSQLGYSYNHFDQWQEALPYLLKALEMGHDEAWVHSEIGWTYRQLGEYVQAIEYFENALLEEIENVWLLAQCAFTYRDCGNTKRAEEYLVKVCRLAPEDDSYFDLANFYKEEQRFEEALDILEKMSDPSFQLMRDFEKGCVLNCLHRYQEAISMFEKCLENGRDDTGLQEELGDAYVGMLDVKTANEHYQKALTYYEKAFQCNQEDGHWILQNMVWIAQKQGDMIRKLQYLDRLLEFEGERAWTIYHYAKTYANLNEFEKAHVYCEKHIKLEGETIENLSLKAWILGKQGQYQEAISLLERIEAMGRKDSWTYCEIAWDYSEMEQFEKAIQYYQKAYEVDDLDGWMISQIAWNKGALKQHEEAIKYFFEAEEKGRVDGWLYANIAFQYLQLVQYEHALTYFEKAKSLGYEEEWFLKRWSEVKEIFKGKKK